MEGGFRRRAVEYPISTELFLGLRYWLACIIAALLVCYGNVHHDIPFASCSLLSLSSLLVTRVDNVVRRNMAKNPRGAAVERRAELNLFIDTLRSTGTSTALGSICNAERSQSFSTSSMKSTFYRTVYHCLASSMQTLLTHSQLNKPSHNFPFPATTSNSEDPGAYPPAAATSSS